MNVLSIRSAQNETQLRQFVGVVIDALSINAYDFFIWTNVKSAFVAKAFGLSNESLSLTMVNKMNLISPMADTYSY
jgi:hypothetical protein